MTHGGRMTSSPQVKIELFDVMEEEADWIIIIISFLQIIKEENTNIFDKKK